MKSVFSLRTLVLLLLALLPFFYLLSIYPELPARVPTHFDASFKPDSYSNKSSLWTLVSMLIVLSMGIYFLLHFLPSIDPKKTAKYSAAVFDKIGIAMVLFLSFINFLILHAAKTGSFRFGNLFPVALGLLFSFLGNLMHSIKPNYFAGIRTPWTLESEETWRKTHQLAGKLWFFGGFLLIAGSLLPGVAGKILFFCLLPVLVLVPVIYSYTYYKSIQKK